MQLSSSSFYRKAEACSKNIPLDRRPQEAWYMSLRVGGLLEHEQRSLEYNYQLSKRGVKYTTWYYVVEDHRFASGRG